jgi:septum formation protein
MRKCLAVYEQEINNTIKGEPALVLSADTIIVTHAGEVMEKPRSEEQHLAILKALRDSPPHKV